MKLFRCLILGLALIGLAASENTGDAAQLPFRKKKMIRPQQGAPNPAARPGGAAPGTAAPATPAADDPMTAPLVSADMLLKLKLTAEQKQAAAKLQAEFAAMLKEAIAKAKEDAAKNGGGGAGGKGGPPNRQKGQGGAGRGAPATPGLNEALLLRSEFEEKFYNQLTEAQQNIWLEAKAKKGEGLLNAGAAGNAKTPNKK